MRSLIRAGLAVGMVVLGLHFPANCAGASFRVASYNLENYLDAPVGTRAVKSDEARSKIQESILAIKPDVLAVQEVGGTNALLELREIIDTRLKANPELNLIVLGDFNDVKDSKSTRVLIGRGRNSLVDTRPAERNGDNHPNPNPRYEPRNITWTHYYGKEDSYSRIDYIFISHGMAKEWLPKETYVLSLPNWGVASDHRPITASFIDKEQ